MHERGENILFCSTIRMKWISPIMLAGSGICWTKSKRNTGWTNRTRCWFWKIFYTRSGKPAKTDRNAEAWTSATGEFRLSDLFERSVRKQISTTGYFDDFRWNQEVYGKTAKKWRRYTRTIYSLKILSGFLEIPFFSKKILSPSKSQYFINSLVLSVITYI